MNNSVVLALIGLVSTVGPAIFAPNIKEYAPAMCLGAFIVVIALFTREGAPRGDSAKSTPPKK